MQAKNYSPWMYLAALVCMVLPFMEFSCQGTKVGKVTGLQLLIGAPVEDIAITEVPSQPQRTGRPNDTAANNDKRMSADPIVMAIYACGLAGMLASFPSARRHAVSLTVLAMAAWFGLCWLKPRIDAGFLESELGVNAVTVIGIVAGGGALALFAIHFAGKRSGIPASVIYSGLGVFGLIWFKSMADIKWLSARLGEEPPKEPVPLGIDFTIGYWSVLALYVAAAIATLMAQRQNAPASAAVTHVPNAASAPVASSSHSSAPS